MPTFTYWNQDRSKSWSSPRKLTDGELADLMAKPLSQDQQALPKAQDLTASITKNIQSRTNLKNVKEALSQPAARSGASAAVSDALRIGGTMGGAAIGHPYLGAAAGDIASQGVDMLSGARGGYSPKETLVNTAMAGFAPGMEGGVVAGAVKGAVYGAGSTTVNSLMENGQLPTVSRLAIGTATGALITGVGRRVLRPSVYEISQTDVARETHAILSGDRLSLDALTPATAEEVREIQAIQRRFPSIQERPSSGVKVPTTGGLVYRGSTGKFRSNETLFNPEPKIETPPNQLYEFKQEDLDFGVPKTAGRMYRSRADVGGLYIGLPKRHFGNVQRETGIPVYAEMFDPIEQAHTREINFTNNRISDVEDSVPGVRISNANREKYQAWLEMKDKNHAATLLGFKGGDQIHAGALQRSYETAFKAYGLEDGAGPGGISRAEEYWTQHWPKLRQAHFDLSQTNPEPSPDEVISKAFPVSVPKSVAFFRDAIDGEGLSPRDTNSIEILAKHMRHGSYKTFTEQHVNNATVRFVNNPNLPEGLKSNVKWYLNQVKGASDPTGRDLGIFVSRIASRFGYKMTPKEARAVVNAYVVSGQYGSTLGFRPGPRFRNFLQTWQTGLSELGPKYWFMGERASRTKAGQMLAHQMGLFGGDPGMVHEVLSGAENLPKGIVGTVGKAFLKTTEKGLVKYSSTDMQNRAIMGLGQYARAMNAIRKANGNANKFIDYAWLDSGIFQPGERQVLTELAHKGEFLEAARRSAIGVADNTQWVYRAGNRAPVTSGTAGRMMTGFYTWGSFYANYLRRLLSPAEMRVNPGKQALRLSRFLLANGAVVGIGSAIGSAAGIEDGWKRMLAWNMFSPAVYTGGPIAQEGQEILYGLNELSQGDFGGPHQKRAMKGLGTFAPGVGVARDFYHLINPDKGEAEAVLRTSGILPRKAP